VTGRLRTAEVQLGVLLRFRVVSGVLLALLVLVPLVVWRNVSYAAESLDANLEYFAVEIQRLTAELAAAGTTREAEEIAARLEGLQDQYVSDRFDVYRSGVPGSAEAALGFAAGAGGPILGWIIAMGVAGTDLRRGTFFWWLTSGTSRPAIFDGKLLALPVLAAVLATGMGVLGSLAAVGFNAWYRSDPFFAPAGPGWGHLAAAWTTTVLLVTLWAAAAVALTFALGSGWAAGLTLGTYVTVDVFLTTQVPGVAPWLLTIRVAQAGVPLWPPESRLTIDTFGYLWWIGPSPATRFPETMWTGYVVLAIVVCALGLLGRRRLSRLDYLPAPDR